VGGDTIRALAPLPRCRSLVSERTSLPRVRDPPASCETAPVGNATSVDGGNDDPDRVWRRLAPGEEPAPAHPSSWLPGSGGQDPQRAIWGPEADAGRQLTMSVPVPAPPMWQPPTGSGPGLHGAPPATPRWEPVVGGPGDDRSWAGPGPGQVGVDERPAPPPRQPAGDRFAGWWTRAGIAAAVLAVVIVVIAVASGSDSGGEASTATSTPATSSPPTTARRTTTTSGPATTTSLAPTSTAGAPAEVDPEELDPEDDPRVMLTDLPDGFTAVNAQLMLDNHIGGGASGLFMLAEGSTWFDGPWIQIGSALEASFSGPFSPVDLGGGRLGRLGVGQAGAELLALDVTEPGLAIAVKGLPAGTASALGAALVIGTNGTWTLPAAAVPPGLHLASGDLAESLTVRPVSSALVNYQGPGGVGLTLHASLARPGYDAQSVASFYLTDVSYVTVGGEPGVMGTYRYGGGALQAVQWRHLGVDIELTAFGMEPSELLALAATASTRADRSWTERTWEAAEDASSSIETPDPVVVQQDISFGEHGAGPVMVQRLSGGLSWWVDANGLGISRYARAADEPVVLQVATNPVPAIDTDGASYVLALALGDESIAGATLRVRTGVAVSGGDGIGHDSGAVVHELAATADDDTAGASAEFGYVLGAAVAVPWPLGDFVAELIAADGVTVLATATQADLR
jgi:hypothetical protein